MEEKKNVQEPAVLFCVLALAAVIGTIAVSVKLGFGTQMSVFSGTVVTIIIALLRKTSWDEIQRVSLEHLANCGVPLMILALVGVLVGVWLIGGTLPTLIYYGLEFISPKAIVPLTFVLCAVTSVFTGTSFGSMATMGLAMYGIGTNMGIAPALIAGAVVSGAYFGDKMSPMSDTTNVAPAMAGTDLYSHIGSMFYTTLPATAVVLLLYIVLGLRYSGQAYDSSTIVLMQDTLRGVFNIHPVCLIPLALVLVLSACRVPSILAMGTSAVVSIALAALTQGAPVSSVMAAALNGYKSATGVAMVDTILTRGGISSMIGTISIIMFSSFMAGGLSASGILHVFEKILLRFVGSARSLVISTLVFGWGMVALTGNQMLGIIVPGRTMGALYDELNVNRKVLSRSLEDSATIGSAIIPWSSAAAYITGVLGVGLEFIPFAFLNYIVPVFSIICVCTGFGIWDRSGEPVWKKKKERERAAAA